MGWLSGGVMGRRDGGEAGRRLRPLSTATTSQRGGSAVWPSKGSHTESRPSLRVVTTEPAPTQSGHTVSRPPLIPVIHSASSTYGADGALMHYTIRPGVKAPVPGKPRLHKLSRTLRLPKPFLLDTVPGARVHETRSLGATPVIAYLTHSFAGDNRPSKQ